MRGPLVALPALLVSCAIPDDGKSDVVGRVAIEAGLETSLVPPGPAADADCTGEVGWGETPAVGDVTPTLYVGLYSTPLDPTDDGSWLELCGEFGDPPVARTESCPIAGTTGVYHAPTADEPWVFEFEIPYVDRGQQAYISLWLDDKCAAGNSESAGLVWDLDGPPDGGDLVIAGPALSIGTIDDDVVDVGILTLDAELP